jgi:signal transduction histidine kinase
MILIVDDKPETISLLKTILERHSFSIDSALSGEEALEKVVRNSYAMLILDVRIQGVEGNRLVEAISDRCEARDIPILFLATDRVDKKFMTRGFRTGGIDCLTMPIDEDILLLKVKTFYRLYEQGLELGRAQASLRREIGTRKELEGELQTAVGRRDEFISIASHELRTPLTTIKAYVQLLERNIRGDEPTRMYVERTLVQVQRLDNLIVDLLDFSKIESGKLNFNKKLFALEVTLSRAVEMIGQTYPDYRITRKGRADVELYGDELRIEQVIVNYLTNAIKYSPNRKEIQIEVSVEPGGCVTVRVKDFGIGIPKGVQANVFNKFYRVEESVAQFQGLGIGLYICSEIIRRHNGDYGVESEPGKGSTFYFSLPVSH